MTVETGFEIVDAIINNPIQAILLFALAYIGFKFFCGCHGFWADMRRDIKFHLKWELKRLQRPIERKLDHSLEWLERKDKAYQAWRSPISKRRWLGYTLIMWTGLFVPLIIWTIFYEEGKFYVPILLICEYVALMSLMVYAYIRQLEKQLQKKKELKNENH